MKCRCWRCSVNPAGHLGILAGNSALGGARRFQCWPLSMRVAPHPFLTYLVNAMVIFLSQQVRMLLIGFLAIRNSHLTE
jgi:hypothetical protein